jgi:hypothetical protein
MRKQSNLALQPVAVLKAARKNVKPEILHSPVYSERLFAIQISTLIYSLYSMGIIPIGANSGFKKTCRSASILMGLRLFNKALQRIISLYYAYFRAFPTVFELGPVRKAKIHFLNISHP